MTKNELLEKLKSGIFYRYYLRGNITKGEIIDALKRFKKQSATAYRLEKIGSEYRYTYTHTDNTSIHYHGQLKGVNIDVIKDGVYIIEYYHNADNGEDKIMSKVLFILDKAI